VAGRVDGKVALITGAARGQGRSHALRLAQEGADIIAVDICRDIESTPYPLATEEDLQETCRLVGELGRRALPFIADVRDAPAMADAANRGVEALGRLDIVCANAGVTGRRGSAQDRAATFRDVMDVNVTGVFLTLEASTPHLISGGRGGSVIITSSIAGLRAIDAGNGYVASKHAVVGLMRSAAIELAPHSIRVNTIHPTNVRTPMILNEPLYRAFRPDLENPGEEDIMQVMDGMHPLPVACLDPEDVSDVVLFLASDAGRYITGTALPVDAGALLK
jgi:(+)-trans-carveol dehydrogenase